MHSPVAELRELALAAQADAPGPWWYDGRDILHHPDSYDLLVIPLPETWHESQRVSDAVAKFIAACSPDVILALTSATTTAPAVVSEPGLSVSPGKDTPDG